MVPKYVATAKHCLYKPKMKSSQLEWEINFDQMCKGCYPSHECHVVLGDHNTTYNDGERRIKIKAVHIPNEPSVNAIQNMEGNWEVEGPDFALIELSEIINYHEDENLDIILLHDEGTYPPDGHYVTALGWGLENYTVLGPGDYYKMSEVLKKAHLVIKNGDMNENQLRDYIFTEVEENKTNNQPIAPCAGDSGGPLMQVVDDHWQWRLLGTLKGHGYDCRTDDYSLLYNRREVWNKIPHQWLLTLLKEDWFPVDRFLFKAITSSTSIEGAIESCDAEGGTLAEKENVQKFIIEIGQDIRIAGLHNEIFWVQYQDKKTRAGNTKCVKMSRRKKEAFKIKETSCIGLAFPLCQKVYISGEIKHYVWEENKKVFADAKCPNIGNMLGMNVSYCMKKCDDTPTCSAINVKDDEGSPDCVLRSCKYPVPSPNFQLSGYKSYYKIASHKTYIRQRPSALDISSSFNPMLYLEIPKKFDLQKVMKINIQLSIYSKNDSSDYDYNEDYEDIENVTITFTISHPNIADITYRVEMGGFLDTCIEKYVCLWNETANREDIQISVSSDSNRTTHVKLTLDESEEVCGSPGQILLQSEAGAAEYVGDALGYYDKLQELHNDRPMYKQRGGSTYLFYDSSRSSWIVWWNVRAKWIFFGIRSEEFLPPTSNNWVYGNGFIRAPDSTMRALDNPGDVNECSELTISSSGPSAEIYPHYMGRYSWTGQWKGGRKVFSNGKAYLRIVTGYTGWMFGLEKDVHINGIAIQSGRSTSCPCSKSTGTSKRLSRKWWHYSDIGTTKPDPLFSIVCL